MTRFVITVISQENIEELHTIAAIKIIKFQSFSLLGTAHNLCPRLAPKRIIREGKFSCFPTTNCANFFFYPTPSNNDTKFTKLYFKCTTHFSCCIIQTKQVSPTRYDALKLLFSYSLKHIPHLILIIQGSHTVQYITPELKS